MLAALTPTPIINSSTLLTNTKPIHQSASALKNNAMNSSTNIRSNGSSFGWGNRERKMEENWRMQNRSI
jgi:hypothetical protein